MKQVVQSIGDGSLRVVEVRTPSYGHAEVLVSTARSLLSTGTEKAVRELAASSRFRPDLEEPPGADEYRRRIVEGT